MKIRIDVVNSSEHTISVQLFDRWYAYKQSQDAESEKFKTNVQIEFGSPEPSAINIALGYMPQSDFLDFESYDFVFFDNAGEPLETATEYIAQTLGHDKTYFVCGAFLSDDHPLKAKIIPYNHNIRLVHDCMTRGFYPQYYHRSSCNYEPNKNMIFINGANRSWRRYFIDCMLSAGVAIDIKSSLGDSLFETAQCAFEDPYDLSFRQKLVNLYPNATVQDYDYYAKSVKVGIDEKFGEVPIGYFLMKEYYQYHCVVFPETAWINHQHNATEKIYKCCVAGTVPFPISGAKIHQLYNAHGYQTAWNLLPTSLQKFDDELDHDKRYQLIVQAISWLADNPDIWQSDAAVQLRQHNQNNFYKNTIDLISVKKLDQVLRLSEKYCD